jgi:phosphate transport system substrate-binding protein
MKKSKLSFAIIALITCIYACGNETKTITETKSITISGAFALYPITVKWAEEYKKLHPEAKIDISAGGAGKGMTDVLSGMADIAMFSREIYPEETANGAYGISVTKDAVVPTFSSSNPYIEALLKTGIKKQGFIDLFITGNAKNWEDASEIKSKDPIHLFTRSDAAGAAETWAQYLGKKQEDLLGVGVFGDPGLATAVIKDPLGIGFNNIVYVYDATTKKQTNGVRIIPIDFNDNGIIDADENFYDHVDSLIVAIATGKYPSPPARELYFVTKGKSQNAATIDFLKYVLTDGQKFVNESGYINLTADKLAGELKKLD